MVRFARENSTRSRGPFRDAGHLWNTSRVIPALEALIALQALDSAAAAARERIDTIPAEIEALDNTVREATEQVDAAQARLAANQAERRELEKKVAAVDTRLARSEDHKAAVKTNTEFTALLREIDTGRAEKDALEEQILIHMEAADGITAEVAAARAAVADAEHEASGARRDLEAEAERLRAELARLEADRTRAVTGLDAAVLTRYEQMLKARRGVAVAAMTGEICSACHVRLRPHFVQQVRRNDSIVQCESCQRVLYFEPPADDAAASA